MGAAEKLLMSVEDYLIFERSSLERHEYHDGEIFAMSGASKPHNIISGNVFAELHTRLRGKRCKSYINDLKLSISSAQRYFYPDVMVVCNPNAFIAAGSANDIVNDATVIVEVLSESTEEFDRGMKFKFYQSLESLRDYVLVSQEKIQVELYHKVSDKEWHYTILDSKEKTLELKSLGLSISLDVIYEDVEFKLA